MQGVETLLTVFTVVLFMKQKTGRKSKFKDPVQITVTFEKADADRLAEFGNSAHYIREIVLQRLSDVAFSRKGAERIAMLRQAGTH